MQANRSFDGFGDSGPLAAHETELHLVQMRAAGLWRDASKLPMLIQSARETTNGWHILTALHSLAQIGGPQALQTVGEVVRSILDTDYVYDYAMAVHARLLAHEAAHNSGTAVDGERAQVWLAAYLRTLGYADANALNAAAKVDSEISYWHRKEPGPGLAAYALQELADAIYHDRNAALLQAAKTNGINFDINTGAWYKVQLMPLTPQQRVAWIVEDLSQTYTYSHGETLLVQLAADEGKLASRAAAAKLHLMDQEREQYANQVMDSKGHLRRFYPNYYYGLLDIIGAVGDSDQEPMLARNLNNPEPDIAGRVHRTYKRVKSGIPRVCASGY